LTWLCCALSCSHSNPLPPPLLLLLRQVIGRLVGNSKAAITSLLTLPSKAEFRSTAEQQAAAGIQPQGAPATGGSSSGTKAGKGRGSSSKGGGLPPQPTGGGAAAAAAAAAAAGGVFVPSVDLLVAGDSAGGLFVWSPFSTPLGSAEREVAPRLAVNGHSGEVWAMCLAPGRARAHACSQQVRAASRVQQQ
jgi:hypothetical protein